MLYVLCNIIHDIPAERPGGPARAGGTAGGLPVLSCPRLRAMLCYAMLCYAMLCYAIPCYAMRCYAMPCYAMCFLFVPSLSCPGPDTARMLAVRILVA